MQKAVKVGGIKKTLGNLFSFLIVTFLFIIYMLPFLLIVINSFKAKRDIIKNPFSILAEKGFSIQNYITALAKMNFFKAFGNSFFISSKIY